MNLFISYIVEDPWFFFSWVIIVTFSICVHEYAHAVVALKCGDETAADRGHLTLNPLVQMGPMSLFLLCVLGVAWGSVPVNPARFRRRTDAALVSFAGPLSNLLLSFVFSACSLAVGSMPMAVEFCRYAAMANGVLFVLNMLPVPMFDGWSVFALFIPSMHQLPPRVAQNVSLFALLVLFMTPLWDVVWSLGSGVGSVWLRLLEAVV